MSDLFPTQLRIFLPVIKSSDFFKIYSDYDDEAHYDYGAPDYSSLAFLRDLSWEDSIGHPNPFKTVNLGHIEPIWYTRLGFDRI